MWIIKLNLNFFRINWSRFRPHFQKRNYSSQFVIQVCKVAKIMGGGRYLFESSKQSYSNTISDSTAQFSLNTYPSVKFHNFYNFERWCKRVE
jgi:hypothetical protein